MTPTGYSVVGLSGGSNNPGSTQAQLSVTGEVDAIGSTTGYSLSLTESEGGFSSPTGNNGMLNSSSSATFTNQPSGGGNSGIMSSYNAVMTGAYSVLSSGTPNPNSQGTSATPISLGTIPSGPLYSLGNMMTISLASGTSSVPVKDGFNTQATVTATTIPEPASMVMFMTGMPLPLVLVGLLRRRRRAVAQG